MPNAIAYLAILIWPIASLLVFNKFKPLPATFITIIGGYLLLPVATAIDLPLIPSINKESVSALSALVGCILIKKMNISLLPRAGIEKWLVLAFILLPFFTFITNTEPMFDGRYWRQGLTIKDVIGGVFLNFIPIIAFLLGLQLVRRYDDQLKLFKFLTIAGLCYSIPILFEIRFSPQLHTWIYGFFPHVFMQQMRGDGYRAVVFIGHGLAVAFFVVMALTYSFSSYLNSSYLSEDKIVVIGSY